MNIYNPGADGDGGGGGGGDGKSDCEILQFYLRHTIRFIFSLWVWKIVREKSGNTNEARSNRKQLQALLFIFASNYFFIKFNFDAAWKAECGVDKEAARIVLQCANKYIFRIECNSFFYFFEQSQK